MKRYEIIEAKIGDGIFCELIMGQSPPGETYNKDKIMENSDQPNKTTLTQVELLELRNLQLQKKVIQLENDKISTHEQIWVARASSRLQLDLKQYEINIDTGECTLRKAD